LAERDPVYALLARAGVQFEETWRRVSPKSSSKKSRKK